MLVLTRRLEEGVRIGSDIEVKVLEINKNSVRLGISAPQEVSVHRKEIYDLIQNENLLAAKKEEGTIGDLGKLIKKALPKKNG